MLASADASGRRIAVPHSAALQCHGNVPAVEEIEVNELGTDPAAPVTTRWQVKSDGQRGAQVGETFTLFGDVPGMRTTVAADRASLDHQRTLRVVVFARNTIAAANVTLDDLDQHIGRYRALGDTFEAEAELRRYVCSASYQRDWAHGQVTTTTSR